MNRFLPLLAALGLLTTGLLAGPLPATAQDVDRQTRSVDAFTRVAFTVPGTLHLRQGESQSVEIEGPSKALDRIETVVDGRQLTVRSDENGEGAGLFGWLSGERGTDDTPPIDVYVTMSTVEALTLAGSGDIVAETPIETDDLDLEIAGSGDIESQLTVARLTINIAGSGDAVLRGRGDEVTVEIAGSGDVQGVDLQAATASVSTAGSGDAELRVTDRLDARIVGSGNVRYHGDPTVKTSIVGSGNVNPTTE
jgi:hypothetical protein